MAFFARLREVNGEIQVVGGPTEELRPQYPGDWIVPCSPVYVTPEGVRFPVYIGPTCTVKQTEDGQYYVEMLYQGEESPLDAVKAMLRDKFNEVFDLIDKKSLRATRAVTAAQIAGQTPDQGDVDVLSQCEQVAAENRAKVRQINEATSVEWLWEHQNELQPVNPWAPQDRFMPGMPPLN